MGSAMPSDMHVHTTFSDGRLTPEEIVAAAKEAGLTYLAITDHDTVDGIRHLYENGLYPLKMLRLIPGVEFSCEEDEHDVHILGYDFDIYNQELADKVNELSESRWTRFSRMMARLQELGYSITEADVMQIAGSSRSIGRAHVARALVKKGLMPTVHDAFEKLLEHGCPAYIPHFRLQPAEAVALIRRAGGIPVLAHPKLVGDDELVSALLTLDFGGLEVYYPQHDASDTARYKALAERHALRLTGGSDFHALPHREPKELGVFTIDDALAEPFFHPPEALE